jgi:hypothetical protein
MRGKKSYNIRNIEAHLTSLQNTFEKQIYQTPVRNMFQTNVVQPSEQQRQNEYINAKYGVSRYTSNLVSGKMFKKL